MAYFSNGTEGMMYEERYCDKCLHSTNEDDEMYGCPVLDLHLFWNYEQNTGHPEKDTELSNAKTFALEMFIEREGIGNKKCKMFSPK